MSISIGFSEISISILRVFLSGSGDFVGIPVLTSCDLEYFNEFHQLPRWNANHPCSLCSVHKSKLLDWKSAEEVQPDLWRLPRSHNCPLFRMLMSPQAVSPDWMHSKLLGIDQRFLSSVCWLLIFQLADSRVSLDARLFQLLHEMKTIGSWNQLTTLSTI